MNANYFERQIAHHERAARGFDAQAHDAGDRDRAARLRAMARAERDDAAQARKRLARI